MDRDHPTFTAVGVAVLLGLALTVGVSASPEGVEGRVAIAEGVATGLSVVRNTTDPGFCGAERRVVDLRLSDSGGVADVLVWLEGEGLPSPEPRAKPVMDNVDCEFEPRAMTLRTGEPVELANSDATLHTVHWRGPSEENVALPLHEQRVTRRISPSGVYRIRCEVHPWMRAWIRVDDHDFHAVTGADGEFRLPPPPPGRYDLVIWHERLGSARRSLTVGAAGLRVPPIELGAPRTEP